MRSILTTFVIAAVLTCGVAKSPLIAQVAQREVIEGIGEASDGDTIIVGNSKIRLVGIDAPELAQKCKNNSGNAYAEFQREVQHDRPIPSPL